VTRLALAAALLLAAPLSGCNGGSGTTLTVVAASSLTQVFPRLAAPFERAHPGVRVRFSFGASSALAAQVRAGAPADVFASASPATMATVVRAGAATDPVTFARNRAEVAVSPGSAQRVRSLADLARVKVALCRPEVPCGALAAQVLTAAGVRLTPVTYGADVQAVLTAVRTGEVDAGVVYVSDVKAAGRAVVGLAVPAPASTAYQVAVLSASRDRELATAFVRLVTSSTGQGALRDAGFGSP
jgi:molybdate transport system substrate-binding protein